MALKSVLIASAEQLNAVLQKDKEFLNYFDIDDHYTFETIYVDIPKLNGVARTEWENIDLNKIPDYPHLKARNTNRVFSNSVDQNIHNQKENDLTINETGNNIQIKINPWITAELEREKKFENLELVIVASLIDSPVNLGGLSRTCEISGIKEMVVNDGKIINNKEFKSLSMSSENWITITEVKVNNLKSFLIKMKENGYTIVGAEQTCESVMLHKYTFPRKCVLVLGNEKEGVPPPLLPVLDICVEIPQFGVVRSLNVHVAGAILIWEYTKQHFIT